MAAPKKTVVPAKTSAVAKADSANALSVISATQEATAELMVYDTPILRRAHIISFDEGGMVASFKEPRARSLTTRHYSPDQIVSVEGAVGQEGSIRVVERATCIARIKNITDIQRDGGFYVFTDSEGKVYRTRVNSELVSTRLSTLQTPEKTAKPEEKKAEKKAAPKQIENKAGKKPAGKAPAKDDEDFM